ncbi:MAG: hypothetical protein ACRETQ_05270 [Gammaproteobacteria bacterium]
MAVSRRRHFEGLEGAAEILGGVFVLLVSRVELTNMVIAFTAPELAEAPGDLIASYLRHLTLGLSKSTHTFSCLRRRFADTQTCLCMVRRIRLARI